MAAPPQADTPAPHRPLILFACMLAMFMAAIESTIVATAMPTIVAVLGGFTHFSWVYAIYLLTQAVTIPLYGKMSDMFGRQPVLLFGAGLFLLGSALCGLAGSMLGLIAFRALQGLGAGAIQPVVSTIVGDIYAPADRGRVQGYISSVWGISSVVGPAAGAFLVQQLSWRFVFWINLPIGIAALAILQLYLRERPRSQRRRIDFAGAALLALGTSTLMLALIQSSALDPLSLAALSALALASLAAFVVREQFAAEPILPLALFGNRVISVGAAGSLVAGALMMGVTGFLPVYVQGIMGRTPTVAGFALAVMSFGWPIASTIGGRLMTVTSYRSVAMIGAVMLTCGAGVLTLLVPERGPVFAGVGAFLIGLGMGFSTTTFMVAAQASVDWGQRGVATSSTIFMRLVGMSFGAALFGAVVNHGLHVHAAGMMGTVNQLMEPGQRSLIDFATLRTLTTAMADALHEVYVMAGALGLIVVALVLWLPKGLNPVNIAQKRA